LDIAEAEVWYAQQAFIGKEPNSYAVAAGRIESAIQAFRKIEDTFGKRQDTSERIQELHKHMLDYQQKVYVLVIDILWIQVSSMTLKCNKELES
jgi:ABC-type Fe3+-citrate transport system substrate-binding protein